MTDDRVERGLRAQLARRREDLAHGAEPVGWKMGITVREAWESLGLDAPVVGYLTSATRLAPGAVHSLAGAGNPVVEPEVAAHLVADVAPDAGAEEAAEAIGAFAPALEIVDLGRLEDVEEILAGNVFHRAVVLGAPAEGSVAQSLAGATARVAKGGEPAGEAAPDATGAPGELLAIAARRLALVGERLRAGQVVICGSLLPPLPVAPGDRVALDLGELGSLEVSFSA
jgi:2-keto-4-pentenoate hydratase